MPEHPPRSRRNRAASPADTATHAQRRRRSSAPAQQPAASTRPSNPRARRTGRRDRLHRVRNQPAQGHRPARGSPRQETRPRPRRSDELFNLWRHHVFLTETGETTVDADLTHHAHAVVEQVFADVIDGPLAHLPPGRLAANAAWLTLTVMPHNLLRAAGCLTGHRYSRNPPPAPDQHPSPDRPPGQTRRAAPARPVALATAVSHPLRPHPPSTDHRLNPDQPPPRPDQRHGARRSARRINHTHRTPHPHTSMSPSRQPPTPSSSVDRGIAHVPSAPVPAPRRPRSRSPAPRRPRSQRPRRPLPAPRGVRHAMRISCVTALLEHTVASHATL